MAIHLKYFENREGDIQLPPNDECYFTLCPKGYERKEANTLDEVDKLQKRLQDQTYRRIEGESLRDELSFSAARDKVVDSLHAKLASSCTSQYEKDFIREWIKLRDEKKRAYHKKMFEYVSFLEMREMDKPRNPEETLGESL